MNYEITRGNASATERLAIEKALNRRKLPIAKRSRWGQPQLRGELKQMSSKLRGAN